MSGQGVPRDEVTARDHMQVRAALVRRLGGANEALVWARIYYRADHESRAAQEIDGELWWPASYDVISEQTGLTPKQARDAVSDLLEKGYIERRSFSGRAFAYRPVVIGHLPHRADTASAPQGGFIGPAGQLDLPSGAIAPLIDLEDSETGASKGKLPETRLPASWVPNAAHYAHAKTLGVDVVAEAESFRLHADTHDRHAARWNSAFTTWLKKARPSAPAPPAIEPGQEWMYR